MAKTKIPKCPRCKKGDEIIVRKANGSLSCGRCVHTWSDTEAYRKVKSAKNLQSVREKLAGWERAMSSVAVSWHASGEQVEAKRRKGKRKHVRSRKQPTEGSDGARK